jgi:hypothetical protein
VSRWPSGLRRDVKAVVFIGVGSNPTRDNLLIKLPTALANIIILSGQMEEAASDYGRYSNRIVEDTAALLKIMKLKYEFPRAEELPHRFLPVWC